MRSIQLVIIVVNAKCRRLPSDGGVASRTIRRYGKCKVIRISALVVIRSMAARTISGCSGIPGSMATNTSRRQVRTRQREIRAVMVKRSGSITVRVAGKTGCAVVRIAVYPIVFIVRLRIGMTGDTGKLRII